MELKDFINSANIALYMKQLPEEESLEKTLFPPKKILGTKLEQAKGAKKKPIALRQSTFDVNTKMRSLSANIKVTSINGIWANFKFKNKSAYILTFYLKKVEIITTGSIKIRYLNVDTNEEIAPYVTHDSLELKSYHSSGNYRWIQSVTVSAQESIQSLFDRTKGFLPSP